MYITCIWFTASWRPLWSWQAQMQLKGPSAHQGCCFEILMSWPLKVRAQTMCDIFVLVFSRWAFRWIIKESLGFCGRASKSSDTRAQLSNTVRAVFFHCVVPCASSLKGDLKIKENLSNLSAVTAYQTHAFMLCAGVCLSFSERIYIDVLNIENLVYPPHKLSCNLCKASRYMHSVIKCAFC